MVQRAARAPVKGGYFVSKKNVPLDWEVGLSRQVFSGGSLPQLINHSVQVGRSAFNIKVLVLPGSALGREHGAAVDLFKIAVGKFVRSLAVLGSRVIRAQMPLCVLAKPVLADELILLLGGGLMFAPGVPVVYNNFALTN